MSKLPAIAHLSAGVPRANQNSVNMLPPPAQHTFAPPNLAPLD